MDELFQNAKKEKQQKKQKNAEKRRIIVIGVILVTLSLGLTIFKITRGNNTGSGKDIILTNLKNNNISDYTDLKGLEKMIEKQNNTPYEATTDIHLNEDTKRDIEENSQSTLSNNTNKAFNNIKIGDLIFSSKSKIEPNKNIGQIQLDVKYKENNIFNFTFLDDGNTISIFEPSYFQEALGFDKKKIKDTSWLPKKQETLEEELEKEELIKNLEFNLSKDTKMNPAKELVQIMNIYQAKYIEELSKLPKEKFKFKKNVPTKYREKEVRADNISLEITKDELENIAKTVKEETKKEISKNISDYSTFKFLTTTKKTAIGNILNSYVLPVENLGIEIFDTTNHEIENKNIQNGKNNQSNENGQNVQENNGGTNGGNKSSGLITLIDENSNDKQNQNASQNNNQNNQGTEIGNNNQNVSGGSSSGNLKDTNIVGNTNRQNANEVITDAENVEIGNKQNQNQGDGQSQNNEQNNIQNNQAEMSDNTSLNYEENNNSGNNTNDNNEINLDGNIVINFYIIDGKDIKIDTVENDIVTSTIEVYTDKKKKKTQELIYGYLLNGRQRKYKITKTEDNGSIYNHIEMQDIVGDKVLNSVNAELVRNQNIEAANHNITYKITKSFGNIIKGSNINKNIKYTDNIEVGTNNTIINVNELDQNAFTNLMVNTIYPQITKVTSEKILQMENLLSVTKENQITGKETEPVTQNDVQNMQNMQNNQNAQNQQVNQNMQNPQGNNVSN